MTKILVIDDDRINLKLLEPLLKKSYPDYEILTVQSGPEGIEIAKKELPDIIILDIRMPYMDGYEVCKHLQSDEYTQPIPVIFLTAYATDSKDVIRGLESGALSFLSKPIGKDHLIAQVNVALRIRMAEKALRESERKFRNYIESSGDIMYVVDKNLKFLYGNRKYLKRRGLTQKELLGKEHEDFHSDEGTGNFMERVKVVRESGKPIYYEYQSELDGRYFLRTLSPVIDSETKESESITVISRDITQRKQAEEALEKSLQQQRLLTEVSFLFTKLGKFEKNMNDILRLIGEYTIVSRVYVFEDFNNGEYTKNTYEWCNKNIEPQIDNLQEIPYTIVPSWKKILNEKGMVFSTNISELPQDIINILEPQKIKSILVLPIYVRNKFFGFLGFDECEKHRIWDNNEIELLKTVTNIISVIFERKQAEEKIKEISKLEKKRLKELRISHDQLQKSQEASLNLMEDLSVEIEQHKQTEDMLRTSEKRYRSLFENIQSSFALHEIVFDKKGKPVDYIFLEVNEAFELQNGLKKKDIIGKNVRDVMPGIENDQVNWIQRFGEVVLTGKNISFEDYSEQKKKWYSVIAYRPKENQFATVFADITDRKKSELEIQQSRTQLRKLAAHLEDVREEERTIIARNIHDELGQLATALKMDISWLQKQLPKENELWISKMQTISDLVDMTASEIQRICSELRPGVLDDLGLEDALEWYVSEYNKRTGTICNLSIEYDLTLLNKHMSVAVYRMIQEALTNVRRHAKASKVTISIKGENGKLKLMIKDNGIGIRKEKIDNSKSFGLLGIEERALSLDGYSRISGKEGKGTTLEIMLGIGNSSL